MHDPGGGGCSGVGGEHFCPYEIELRVPPQANATTMMAKTACAALEMNSRTRKACRPPNLMQDREWKLGWNWQTLTMT